MFEISIFYCHPSWNFLQPVQNRITFDKSPIECDGFQEEKDELVHELLCDDVKLDNDEDIFGDNMEIIDEF